MLTDPQSLQNQANRDFRDLAGEEFDTSTLLRNAADQAVAAQIRGLPDRRHRLAPLRNEAFKEIVEYIDDPVMRDQAKYQGHSRAAASPRRPAPIRRSPAASPARTGASEKVPPAKQRDIASDQALDGRDRHRHGGACSRRRCSAFGLTPRPEVEVAMARAYNRWLCERVLAEEPRIKSSLYLPINDPEATYEIVKEFGDSKGVIGFTICSPHYKATYDNAYVKTYALIEETRPAARFPRRLRLGPGSEHLAVQPLHRACTRWAFPGSTSSLHQLALQRDAGALPETEDDLDRKRSRLDPVPDAAPRQ